MNDGWLYGEDVFIMKVSSDLSTASWKIFWWARADRTYWWIAINSNSWDIYLLWVTNGDSIYDSSWNLIISRTSWSTDYEPFLLKLSSDLSVVTWRSYWSLRSDLWYPGIAINPTSWDVYISWYTTWDSIYDNSWTLIVSRTPWATDQETFLLKVSSDLSIATWKLYWGWVNDFTLWGLALNKTTWDVYMTIRTNSTVISDELWTEIVSRAPGGDTDVALLKVSSDLSSTEWIIYWWTWTEQVDWGIAITPTWDIYLYWRTSSSEFDKWISMTWWDSSYDLFLIKVSSDLSNSVWNIYWGTGPDESSFSLPFIDSSWNVYLTGYTKSSVFSIWWTPDIVTSDTTKNNWFLVKFKPW